MLFRLPDRLGLYALLREQDNFGFPEVDLAAPPARFWSDGTGAPPSIERQLDRLRVGQVSSPIATLRAPPEGSALATTRQSLARARAWLLICEDPQRRLEARAVQALSHQASLIEHVLGRPELSRVLIADEVGLGKTIEAALLVQRLLAAEPNLRVLYLAPARLVRNVHREFERLSLSFRQWVAGPDGDARIEDDDRVIASIHRAAHKDNLNRVINGPPWDLLIVDECHHLTDWQEGGGKPARKYTLVQRIIERLRPDGRVVLLSGTPHQGHHARFENLLSLLRRPGEPEDAVRGRVIYRTKEDVVDWEGRPLFPSRQVNQPVIVNLGPSHRDWLVEIHDLYVPPTSKRSAKQRASGWRCAQALQWATSSVEAGLGYLVRQAIRAGWTLAEPALREALAALRPYRQGRADERVEALYARIEREVLQQQRDHDLDDIEDHDEDEPWRPDPARLSNLLLRGVEVLSDVGDAKWKAVDEQVLRAAGDEPVVLFAQPIETVTAVARYLERAYGVRPALILGGQTDTERDAQVERFTAPDGPRFLVSSRAGGEGINLQTARRLVHLDVPWNPMEMEQRIGRVHRFGSRRTIIVDTVVVRDSREVDALRIARAKLHEIARTLVPEDRFEALFGRVMALIPPQELQAVLSDRALAPLNGDEQSRIARLVTDGFAQWDRFHQQYGEAQRTIKASSQGRAQWDDLVAFAREHLSAEEAPGFEALRFAWQDGEIISSGETARALRVRDDKERRDRWMVVGDLGGMPVRDDDGRLAEPMGTNLGPIARALRQVGLAEGVSGAGWVRWPPESGATEGFPEPPFGLLVMARCSLGVEGPRAMPSREQLVAYVITEETQREIDPGVALRAAMGCVVRARPEAPVCLLDALEEAERSILDALRRPTEQDRATRTVHAVYPLLALVASR